MIGQAFAWVPRPLRRVFVDKAGRDRYRGSRAVDQRLKLPQCDRALFDRSKILGPAFLDAGVTFTLAALSRGALVQSLNAAIECANLFVAGKFVSQRRRPFTFVPAGEDDVRPFLVLCVRYFQQ